MRIKNNCRKATLLIEKKLSDRIDLFEKMELTLHLAGCPACRLYLKQSQLINEFVLLFLQPDKSGIPVMDESFKEEIKEMIIERLEAKGNKK